MLKIYRLILFQGGRTDRFNYYDPLISGHSGLVVNKLALHLRVWGFIPASTLPLPCVYVFAYSPLCFRGFFPPSEG